MDLVIATNSVPLGSADTAPPSGTPQYFTSGNSASSPQVPPTLVPGYWLNMMQAEIRNVIVAAGLTPDGTNLAQLLAALPLLHGRQIWASAGSYNWTCPAGVTRVRATAIGAGGGSGGSSGSGSAGSAGGSGEYRTGFFTVVPGTVYGNTLVAGGAGGSGNGTAGGAVSFASFMTAMGGGGGYEGIGGIENSVSGAGGTGGSGGDFSWPGALGGYGYLIGSGGIAAAIGVGAYGFGNNGPETGASAAAGAAGKWPGSSGNGGIFGGAGGAGADGLLILEW